jgi:hypothetical protein
LKVLITRGGNDRSLGAGLADAIEEGSETGFVHPVAVLQVEDERLHIGARFVALDLHAFGVEGGGPHRFVHVEFANVVERLFSAERILIARRELAVVVQLNGSRVSYRENS